MKLFYLLCLLSVISQGFTASSNGIDLRNPRIIGGEIADEFDAQYIVSYRQLNGTDDNDDNEGEHFCAGVIISEHFTLTAGHCLFYVDWENTDVIVIAGSHTLSPLIRGQTKKVDAYVVHPEYFGGVGAFDIALALNIEPFIYTEYLYSVALPDFNTIPEGEARFYGWGATENYSNEVSNDLQVVNLEIISNEDCIDALIPGLIHPTNICTMSIDENVGICTGDNGGPLVQTHPNGYDVLIGLGTWQFDPCAVPLLPNVFQKVSAYNDWIEYMTGLNLTFFMNM